MPGGLAVGILGRESAGAPLPADADLMRDLGLDVLVDGILKGREHLDLAPLFRLPLDSLADVTFRQEVFRDLGRKEVRLALDLFQTRMGEVAIDRAREQASYNVHEKGAWMLSAVRRYGQAVKDFEAALGKEALASEGLRALADWLGDYVADEAFRSLCAGAEHLHARLASLRYTVQIQGRHVFVRPGDEGDDMGARVAATFAPFAHAPAPGAAAPPQEGFRPLNHVESAVLDGVASGFPDLFAELASFRDRHDAFVDPVLARFGREVEFYRSVLEAGGKLAGMGLHLTRPAVDEVRGEVVAEGLYDMALALGGTAGRDIVTNDLALAGDESIVVVTGPNQGGKSTFARAVGQALHLARLGCPVPATKARLPLVRHLLTHFEREDEAKAGEGRLAEELVRMKEALQVADEATALIMNESFSSTALADARWIGERVLAEIRKKGALAVFVTFIDELANLGGPVVSMTAQVDPADPAVRTFRIVRQKADGRAYAHAIARRYRVSREDLSERLRR